MEELAELAPFIYLPVTRFMTCGSVDDGKSTLIGRLLYDSAALQDDQIASLERGRQSSAAGTPQDFFTLLDGLEEEREQGITIDIGFKYFSTKRRRFIIADSPGHEQYTRNMATAASQSDVAVLLVDATKGLKEQSLRHFFICKLFGIKFFIFAINKMDLVNFNQAIYEAIVSEVENLVGDQILPHVRCVPVSALRGDNIANKSGDMAWYTGETVLAILEQCAPESNPAEMPARAVVQTALQPNHDTRLYACIVLQGEFRVGQHVAVPRTEDVLAIEEIIHGARHRDSAGAGAAILVKFDGEYDLPRGTLLAGAKEKANATNGFSAEIISQNQVPLISGRSYVFKINGQYIRGTITRIKGKFDLAEGNLLSADRLSLNDIGRCDVQLSQRIGFDKFDVCRHSGSFVIVDPLSSDTLGAGVIRYPLRRSENVIWHEATVKKPVRQQAKGHESAIIWLTGLSGAGKSTIANILDQTLHSLGLHTYVLDGDNVRHGLNRDLGFTEADRVENIRRIGEVARLFVDAGIITICSFISPYQRDRRYVRDLVEPEEFIEVHVDASLEECMRRDPKGLYKKAMAGQIPNFTGVGSPYESPKNPEIRIDSVETEPTEAAEQVLKYLQEKQFIPDSS